MGITSAHHADSGIVIRDSGTVTADSGTRAKIGHAPAGIAGHDAPELVACCVVTSSLPETSVPTPWMFMKGQVLDRF